MPRFLACLTPDWPLASSLAESLNITQLPITHRRHPDQESHLVVGADVDGAEIVLLANLHHPDQHTLPVLLLAATLRDLGARHIHLVAPYLAYMRQDIRFQPGEGVTSRYYARLLSSHVDALTTIDPHLHRYHALDEIYTIPDTVLHAAPVLAEWVSQHVSRPLLVGPDSESEQWVREVAEGAGADYVIGSKQRQGDRSVRVTLPDLSRWHGHTPVLVDDIISSGRTMIEANRAVMAQGLPAAICLGVHAVFDTSDYQTLQQAVDKVMTCDCIPHASNGISVAALLASALQTAP